MVDRISSLAVPRRQCTRPTSHALTRMLANVLILMIPERKAPVRTVVGVVTQVSWSYVSQEFRYFDVLVECAMTSDFVCLSVRSNCRLDGLQRRF